MGEYFPILNSTLCTTALLREILPNYDLGSVEDCNLLNIGLNDTYLLTGNGGERHILRVYRSGWRTLENIRYEIDVLCHLYRKGVQVSIPLPRKNGNYVNSVEAPEGTRYIVYICTREGAEL